MSGITLKIDLNELYTLANSKRWKSSEIGKIKADLLGRYYKRELENASNRAFDRQTSPDGRPWLPRSPKYAKQLNRRRPG
ncbi:MAG: phage virion morphogenesis protein, partial [Candidatus Bruticola sp.]